MEQESLSKRPTRHSFRAAKISSNGVDRFGHTIINKSPIKEVEISPTIDVQTGELKYDIGYEAGLERTLMTPEMQKFMKNRGIEYNGEEFNYGVVPDSAENEVVVESVEMPDDIESLVDNFDNFDELAEGLFNGTIASRVQRQVVSVGTPKVVRTAQNQSSQQSSGGFAAFCSECRFKFKSNEKFCPQCGETRAKL
jgi:hypothetical protein